MAITKFQDLNLKNSFLFAAFMQDPENAKLMLELLLSREIGNVEVHTEHSILYNSDFKSVRLDVFLSEDSNADFDLEMQDYVAKNLPKRSRYYQSQMDVSSLKPGEDYNSLRSQYVIFICTFDPFGRGRYRYTFENQCQEEPFLLGDGTTRIFLNTKGMNPDEVPEHLVKLLHYIEDSTEEYASDSTDTRIRKIHENVSKLKQDRTWEGRYMTFEEWLERAKEEGREEGREMGREEGRKEGREEGLVEGENIGISKGVQQDREQLSTLAKLMDENGESDQVERLLREPDYLDEMLHKYQLES